MVLRIKGKHLVISVVILLALVLIIGNFGGHLLYQYANLLQRMGYTDKANVYYSRVTDLYAQKSSGLLAEYKRVQNILIEGNFKFSTTFTSLSGGSIFSSGYIGYQTVDSVNEQYEILKMNKKVSPTMMGEYTLGVALVNWFGGRADEAIALLESFETGEERLQALRDLYLANIYFYLGDSQKSLQALTHMPQLTELAGYQEDVKVLNQLFNGESDEILYEHDMIYTYDGDNVDCLMEPLKFTRSFIEIIHNYTSTSQPSGNILTGRITYEGIPQKNVMVYLKQSEYQNGWSSTGVGDGRVALGISDQDGYFKIANIPNGVYGIVLDIPWQRVTEKNLKMHSEFDMVFAGNTSRNEDITLFDPIELEALVKDKEVTFRWPTDNNIDASYTLNFCALEEQDGILRKSNYNQYGKNISGNEVTLNLEELQKTAYGLSFTYDGTPEPREYIEPFYATGDYGYILYGQENDMLYYSSEGIQPNRPVAKLTVQGSDWTAEDRLLLDGKFEEARLAYEALLEKEPENIHALKVLSRLYSFGYIPIEKDGRADIAKLGGKDDARALELLERLDKLVDSDNIKSALASQYKDVKQYQKAIELKNILLGREPNPYIDLTIGELHLYSNQFPESVPYFKKAAPETEDGALLLLLMGILLNDDQLLTEGASHSKVIVRNDVKDLAEAYIKMDKSANQTFYEYVRQNQIDKAQQWLENRNGESDEFLKAALLLTRDLNGMDYEEKEALFKAHHEQIKDPVLDELLLCFARAFITSAYMSPYN